MRSILLILIASLALGLAGCGTPQQTNSGAGRSATPAAGSSFATDDATDVSGCTGNHVFCCHCQQSAYGTSFTTWGNAAACSPSYLNGSCKESSPKAVCGDTCGRDPGN